MASLCRCSNRHLLQRMQATSRYAAKLDSGTLSPGKKLDSTDSTLRICRNGFPTDRMPARRPELQPSPRRNTHRLERAASGGMEKCNPQRYGRQGKLVGDL